MSFAPLACQLKRITAYSTGIIFENLKLFIYYRPAYKCICKLWGGLEPTSLPSLWTPMGIVEFLKALHENKPLSNDPRELRGMCCLY